VDLDLALPARCQLRALRLITTRSFEMLEISCEALEPSSDMAERISTSMNFSAISVAPPACDCGSPDPATLIAIAAIRVSRANELVIRNEICRAA